MVMICGHTLPIVRAACTGNNVMPVTDGYVGNTKVRVNMLDTGCSTVVVRSNLIDDSQLLGITEGCVLMDGTVRKYPVATVKLDTPYYSGNVKALCMKNPVYDVVIGNIAGARSAQEPDQTWRPEGHDGKIAQTNTDGITSDEDKVPVTEVDSLEVSSAKEEASDKKVKEAQAVQTRAQKQREERPVKGLKMPDVSEFDVPASREEIMKAQKENESLERYWKLAEKEK